MSHLKEIYGQKQAKNLLGRSLAGGRLAHAYLFRGPEGVGKQLFARRLAAAVNCEHNEGLNPCGSCSSCKKMTAETHPDFLLVSPDEKGAIKIAQVRDLIKKLSFAPYEAKMRVVLLEDVHTMRQEAANSLLKTLEEPPEDNILILTADSTGGVLQTIVSRCQSIPFYALSFEETCTVLKQQEEGPDQEDAELLARLSEGSPGKALLLYHSELLPLWEELIELLKDPGSKNDPATGKLLIMAEKMAELKENLPQFLGLLRLWLRDCLFVHHGCGDRAGGNTRKEWNSEQYFDKLGAIDHAEKELARNCNRSLVCEVLLFHLTA